MSTIGLLPAAGFAKRIGGLPKFLFPITGGTLLGTHYRRMNEAGISYVLIAAGKHNFSLLEDYAPINADLYIGHSKTMAEDVLLARRYTRQANILLGMPDTYWTSPDVYRDLLAHRQGDIAVAVAVWRIREEQRGQLGQVDIDGNGYIRCVVDKDPQCPFEWAWGAILWTPAFWKYIKPAMSHVGYALQPAINAGLKVKAVKVSSNYYDCGTEQGYFQMIRETTGDMTDVRHKANAFIREVKGVIAS